MNPVSNDQQFKSLVVRRAGLTDDCLLPTSFTELTGLVPVGIISDFSDDLHTTVGVSATKWLEIWDNNLFHLPHNLVHNISLPHRKIVFTGTGNAPCKSRKRKLGVSYRFGGKDIYTYQPQ